MYIKFCRSYGEDKKDQKDQKDEANGNLSPELSVELDGGKDKQTEGNARLFRAACLFLTVICLLLLLVVIILSVKLQTGSTVCSERGDTTAPFAPKCSYEKCQALFSKIQPHDPACKLCPQGWRSFGRWCFYLSTFRMSWDESQKNCTARGGALAVVTSQKVQSFLTKEGNMDYWIGLRHKGDTWTWVDNTVLRESYWEATSEGDCGILSTNKPTEKNWSKASCAAYTYFICQLQL
ncbi:early activation antigen CD69 isoform X1 [Cottoperca gobio]|uniref:Early activation antigen CD69 isoform X1 n=1 Tax=Cottoperca gobio TaxID=56716 RepID=A0A6J2RD93_COTGO|nr:early activation antigen CD69-like isoform X1 [Cottoperca gobio]